MAGTTQNFLDLTIPKKVLRPLEGLRRTQTGMALYSHIQHQLEDIEKTHIEIERAYADLINILLEAFAKQFPGDTLLKTQIRLIQMQLLPPVALADLRALRAFIEKQGDAVSHITHTNNEGIRAALMTLVEEYGFAVEQRDVESPHPPHPLESTSAELAGGVTAKAESRVDAAYRQHLMDKREGIIRIQENLAKQVSDAIKQNEQFGVFLEVELEALRQAKEIRDINTLRETTISEVEKLLEGHRSLATKLDNAQNYLQLIESDSQELSDELTRVHLLSLTDELTSLPNRRAFLRRLEDEVARVQRYGNPLSLALIDLDGFKAINDKHGHAAGDEVLRTYASFVLPIFRHHDLVARYGGEEFAVILPNTDSEGAMRALKKVQKRAAETTFQHGETTLQLPTFSAGLALYKPGETPGFLIERTDNVLYRAKRLGRNRIEIDLPDSGDVVQG